MAVEPAAFILGSERALMLLDISVDCIARANPCRSPPQHIFMPALPQLILRAGILAFIDIRNHAVDQAQCCLALLDYGLQRANHHAFVDRAV